MNPLTRHKRRRPPEKGEARKTPGRARTSERSFPYSERQPTRSSLTVKPDGRHERIRSNAYRGVQFSLYESSDLVYAIYNLSRMVSLNADRPEMVREFAQRISHIADVVKERLE